MRIFLQELLRMSLLGTLLGLVLLILQPVFHKLATHRVCYYLWLVVLLRLCVPFGVSLPIPTGQEPLPAPVQTNAAQNPNGSVLPAAPSQMEPQGQDTPVTGVPAPEKVQPVSTSAWKWTWTTTIFAVWCIGTVFFLGRYTISYRRLTREIRKHQIFVGYKQGVEVIASQVSTPLLIGVFHPTIVLPQVVERSQLDDILAHELTHARRHDLLYKWFAAFVTSLHWFNPFMVLFRRAVNRACELSCDEAVTRDMPPEARRRYGETLLSLAAGPAPRFGAVALCEEKQQLKERLIFLVKGSKKGPLALVMAVVLTVTVCGCAVVHDTHPAPVASQPDGPTGGDVSSGIPDGTLLDDPILYEVDGYTIALPREWEGKVLVNPDPLAENELISVYEKKSYEQSEWGAGFLFSLAKIDSITYEDYLAAGGWTGAAVFAQKGETYFYYGFPTDVQFHRADTQDSSESMEEWEEWVAITVRVTDVIEDFIVRNDLSPEDGSEFFERDFTYDGEHRYVMFYPFYDYQDLTAVAWQDAPIAAVLSQPVKQGQGGIWCVERYFDVLHPDWYVEMPTYSGMVSADYYNMLQAQADDTGESEYLTLEGAVRAWVRDSFQDGRTVSPESIVLLVDEPAGRLYRLAEDLLGKSGAFGWVSSNELVRSGACPDGVDNNLYNVLEKTPWVNAEGASIDSEKFVYYETEDGGRIEIDFHGTVRIEMDGKSRLYRPLVNKAKNGQNDVYEAAVQWCASLAPHTLDEIEETKEMARKEFQKRYPGCTLNSMIYLSGNSQWEAETKELNAENVIELSILFTEPGMPDRGNGWYPVFVRDDLDQPWRLAD